MKNYITSLTNTYSNICIDVWKLAQIDLYIFHVSNKVQKITLSSFRAGNLLYQSFHKRCKNAF